MEIVYGDQRHAAEGAQIAAALSPVIEEGTLYLGYPVLSTSDSRVQVDALLLSEEHGVVAFQVSESIPATAGEWELITDSQDRLFAILEGHLSRQDSLRRGRGLAFDVTTVTVFAGEVQPPPRTEGVYIAIDNVVSAVTSLAGLGTYYSAARSALERVTNIKPARARSRVNSATSRGGVMREIEKGIANLDRWQKKAAIETPDGPQRIRGLAGSGKTVVLALKAAYLHAQHPDWHIAVTYYSRSLSEQIDSLVSRLSFEHSYEAPDPDFLRVLHTWGGRGRAGLYTEMARHVEAPIRDFQYATASYGMDNAFRGICRELLDFTEDLEFEPLFDAVLIDEAQDLPTEFFQLVYRFTKEPKRIVWAYDELQRLSESAMPTTGELFGFTDDGQELVNIQNRPNEARKDIVLEVCYRNSPWALASAHALGFGIYRSSGLVQHFDDYALWDQIGYDVVQGSLSPGNHVKLRRSRASYPSFFDTLLKPDDAVVVKNFSNELSQDEWIASEIERDLTEGELEPDDILVVIPDTYTAKKRAVRLGAALARRKIPSHNVGVNTSAEQVFVQGSVAMTQIYRAKGNEAPMVYVIDAQYGTRGSSLVHNRNILFTAITRSRAWVRITGHGAGMEVVASELEKVKEAGYGLEFALPTATELAHLRRVHRDRAPSTARKAKRATENLNNILDQLENGEIDASDLSSETRARLLAHLQEE